MALVLTGGRPRPRLLNLSVAFILFWYHNLLATCKEKTHQPFSTFREKLLCR